MSNDLRLELAARTNTGRVRLQNEDCVAVSPSRGFAVLADGMGGYSAGEVASSIAVAVVRAVLERELAPRDVEEQVSTRAHARVVEQVLNDAIQTANTAVLEVASTEAGHAGMGTTIVVAVLGNGAITIAHVGDSRAYRLRRGEMVQLTRDHSLLQEQIDAGLIHPERARYAQNKHLVTRAVGVGLSVEVEVNAHSTEWGDVYLLCSDGLSDMLTNEEMLAVLTRRGTSLEASCNMLIECANESGGYDNISVALMRVGQPANPEEPSLLDRIRSWIS